MPRKSTRPARPVTANRTPPRARRIAFGGTVLRIVLVAVLAAGAAAWALVRHFSHPFEPMLVPEGSAAPGSSEIEVTFDPSVRPAPPPSPSPSR